MKRLGSTSAFVIVVLTTFLIFSGAGVASVKLRDDATREAERAQMATTVTHAATKMASGAPAISSIKLDLEDIRFSPVALTIPANANVTIHITNKGATVHDFSIDELKISTGDVAPGSSVDVAINAPAGTYAFYCNVPGHEAAGMKGTLTVTQQTSS